MFPVKHLPIYDKKLPNVSRETFIYDKKGAFMLPFSVKLFNLYGNNVFWLAYGV